MGKLTMFFGFVFVITCLAGGFLMGDMPFASTKLTAAIDDDDTTITVASTTGFRETGILIIGAERIAYSEISDTQYTGTLAKPLVRGTGETMAVAHAVGEDVRMIESALINSSIDYDLAILADSAGAQAFISVPTALFDILMSFGTSPFAFLGTDLQFITVLWGVMFLGMIVSFFIQVAGGRRV